MTSEQEKLYFFLRGEGKDNHGRTIEDVLSFSDFKLETTHNYIQWLFPIDTESNYAQSVPLTKEMTRIFKNDETVVKNVHRAYEKMLCFYGYALNEEGMLEKRMPEFKMMAKWLNPGNHNFLRFSRMLRSMHLLDMTNDEASLFVELEELANKHGFLKIAYGFWKEAVEITDTDLENIKKCDKLSYFEGRTGCYRK